MIRNLVQLAEIFAVLLCMSALYGRKLKFDIYAVVLIILDVFLFTGINEYGFPGYLAAFSYIGLFVYGILRYKAGTKCALINSFLAVVIVGALQLILYLPLFYLVVWKYGVKNGYELCINAGCILILLVLEKRMQLVEISKFFLKRNKLLISMIIFVLLVLGIRICIVNQTRTMSGENYVQMVVFFILFFLIVNEWQRSRVDAEKKKTELEMNKLYYSAYDELISVIRKRQHDIKNHMNVMVGMGYTINNYDELITKQQEYCDCVVERNAISKVLLSIDNPLISGFLFRKIQEAETKRIVIEHKIILKGCKAVSEYELVEILGILIDNAIEAMDDNIVDDERRIIVSIEENETNISVEVANASDVCNINEMESFWEKDVSSKGEGRGIGLYKLKELVLSKQGDIIVANEVYNNRNYLSFTVLLPWQKMG